MGRESRRLLGRRNRLWLVSHQGVSSQHQRWPVPMTRLLARTNHPMAVVSVSCSVLAAEIADLLKGTT